jgi:hypothetical protein
VRPRPALIRLLAVLLLMQWGTAFGHCLALAAPAGMLHLEICTADGLQRVSLPADQQDLPATPQSGGICPACAGPGAAALPAPTVTIAPPALFVQAPEAPPPSTPRPAPPPRCQPPPRAPPTS